MIAKIIRMSLVCPFMGLKFCMLLSSPFHIHHASLGIQFNINFVGSTDYLIALHLHERGHESFLDQSGIPVTGSPSISLKIGGNSCFFQARAPYGIFHAPMHIEV